MKSMTGLGRWTSVWIVAGSLMGLVTGGCGGDDTASIGDDLAPDASMEGLVPGDGDAETGDGDADGLSFEAYDAVVEQFVKDHDLAGATTAVVHREMGIVHVAGYGEFEADRLSMLASSSKILSVGVLMRLQDQGMLDVDTPIGDYLMEPFGDGGDDKETLTVAQLVSNSSGLVGLIDDPTFAPYICQYLKDGTLEGCAKSIYTTTDDTDQRVAPDSQFRYGGGQWQLAGGVAEVVSGKSWAELVQETYVDPCGTDSLGYVNQFQDWSTNYPEFDQDPSQLGGEANPSIEGGAHITPEDYGKVLLMHLRGGTCDDTRVLSEEAVAQMQADRIATYGGMTPSPTLQGYGMGWWVDREHEGVVVDGGAYGATPWLDNERGYGAIIILEAESALGSMVYGLAKPELDAIFDALP